MAKKYTYNEDYFESLDSPEKAYWLGFLYADGCNNTGNGCVNLTTHSRDIDILEKFKQAVESTNSIKKLKDQNYHYFTVNCKKLSKDLEVLGCMRRKTFKLEFPDINCDLIPHFIRGYFDGDGHIGFIKNKPRVNFMGTESFLTSVSEYLDNTLNIGLRKLYKCKNKDSNIRTMWFTGRLISIKIRDLLYKDATVYLNRKRDKFYSIVE